MSDDLWVGPTDDPDRLRLGAPAASGSEGVLYRGSAVMSGKTVPLAVKMLHPAHLGRLADWTARWREQAELLRRAEVPGLVRVLGGFVGPLPHSKGNADDSTMSLYLIMEWVDGVSLDRWARSLHAPEPEQLLLALLPVAAALDLLHSGAATGGKPVVHRDVKPANILIRPSGETVLVDLGSIRGMLPDDGPTTIAGTIGYMAPEVRRGATFGPAGDRYSIGSVAYFLLTAEEPPIDASRAELRRRLLRAPIVQGREDIADHLLAMLDDVAERRPTYLANWVAQLRRSSLAVLPGELMPLGTQEPSTGPASASGTAAGGRRRRVRRLAAGAAVLALAAAGVTIVLRNDQPQSTADRPTFALETTEASVPAVAPESSTSASVTTTISAPSTTTRSVTTTTTGQVAPVHNVSALPPVDLGAGGPPPWQNAPVTGGPAGAIAVQEWSNAEFRSTTRPLVLADTYLSNLAVPRRSNAGSGWAVAWDDPGKPGVTPIGDFCDTCGRGVVGIGGTTDTSTSLSVQTRGADRIVTWSDGSWVAYRSTSPSFPSADYFSASVYVSGQKTLYTLWTYLGLRHLEYLLSQVRFIDGA